MMKICPMWLGIQRESHLRSLTCFNVIFENSGNFYKLIPQEGHFLYDENMSNHISAALTCFNVIFENSGNSYKLTPQGGQFLYDENMSNVGRNSKGVTLAPL